MIDIVVFLISLQYFKILTPQNFTPHADFIYKNQALKAVQNFKKQSVYVPRLTLSRRMNLQGTSEIMLTIEASLPKLVFGNNLQELQVKDFDAVVVTLQSKLASMGVEISVQHLAHADITSVHFSKNIVLKDGSTPFHYIQQMQNSVQTSKLDTNKTNYRNAGHCFKWHCNSYEIVIYDKLYDLIRHKQNGPKRSIDSDNFLNLKILERMRSKHKKFEVLRMEIRLNKRTIIKKLFKALNIKNNLTFGKIFKLSITKKVLLYYLDLIEQQRSQISNFKSNNDQALLSTLVVYNPSAKPKDILSCIGYKKLLETMTADEIKKLFKKQYERSWNRMMSMFNNFVVPTNHNSFEIIKKQVSKYKPLRIKDKTI